MQCPNPTCGKQIADNAAFCPYCGSKVPVAAPDAGGGRRKVRARGPLVAGAVIVAVALIAAVAFGIAQITAKPQLSEEAVIEALEPELASKEVEPPTGTWFASEPLEYVSSQVDSISEVHNADDRKVVIVKSTYENASVTVTVTYETVFYLEDDAWQYQSFSPVEQTYVPSGHIADEALIEHVPSFLEFVDEEHPVTEPDGDEVSLMELYGESFQAEVLDNSTGESGGSATLAISAMHGISSYAGEIEVSFDWDDEAGDWTFVDVRPSDDIALASFDGLLGTWTGEFYEEEHNDSIYNLAACYGGRVNPPSITLKSIDEQAMTAVVDITCLVHGHGSLDNPADSAEGDEVITVNDVLITLEPDRLDDWYQVYEQERYRVFIQTGSDGTLRVKIETMYIHDTGRGQAWRTDYFTMTRVDSSEEAPAA